jgi:hypothetical protein
MTYLDVDLAIGGALCETQTFTGDNCWQDYSAWLLQVQHDDFNGETAEVFMLEHDHEITDCECSQYLIDHRPNWTNQGTE